MAFFVGADIGGTFTDIVAFDLDRNRLIFTKSLTNYDDFVEEVIACLGTAEIEPRAIEILKHGTTLVINTLLERTGARTALVTTRGFRDILEIGRAGRPAPFDLDYARNPPLVPRHLRFEIGERMRADGSPLLAPASDELAQLVTQLRAAGVDAVAVAFINAYRNPRHEEEVAAYLRGELPNVYVTCSTELSREWFEYERTSTAVANAYVGPRSHAYLDRFERRLGHAGFGGGFFMMGSNGGILSVRRSKEEPVALVESGPIGGCMGAAAYARALGLERLVAFDMGGTTAKCALVENHSFEIQSSYHVGGYDRGFPLQTPVLDIVEVGTGGGSIAYVDAHRRLRVGPRSAGSHPGPVCFGRGGAEPTVTDANLVLGRISGGAFLGGALRLDGQSAANALVTHVGGALEGPRQSLDDIAAGVIDLANAQMATAVKEITIERGKDVRDFDLFVFGGGGPLHGVSLARELHIGRVIVPPEPGNFSALGMLLADARLTQAVTFLADLREDAVAPMEQQLAGLRAQIGSVLHRDFPGAPVSFEHHADMRYKGQRHAIRVALETPIATPSLQRVFLTEYRRRFGLADEDAAIEIIGVRVTATAATRRPELARLHRAGSEAGSDARAFRDVYFPEVRARLRTPIYLRYGLPVGARIDGPAVIEEYGATAVIGPGDRVTIGRYGELQIDLRQGGA
jgi:N-methylhydantoinase A